MSGGELALRLFAAFRHLVDRVHVDLAEHGHPRVRPTHGFALQAVGPTGATAGELATRLGVTKQAAGKTVDALEALGYVERAGDPQDARRKIVALTATGSEVLGLSARFFDRAHAQWVATVGDEQAGAFEQVLRTITDEVTPRLDAASWLGDDGRRQDT
ncbi:MarR family winged helix-turn-helix transcriptional regulator [Actinomycetospora termitidis]|uniref:MarR family winged helix-turn-helix transcriptional regulator n=1 Tax=Actinomycetospora termitidis TaxID=3053470 RepID=A0ABT7MCN2_9PSEU|nr:MarR family winged helix-turn-helix transcriptional regulator [Actinomycetospora sp. Odt1-22]MDL5158431.1 MarR family winged helix-turn-helix transcriptional regulator [Actinomycetospora sp. Odt1-22]